MKSLLFAAASLLIFSTPVMAATVVVATDLNAPMGNFQTPGNTATAGYSLTLSDDGTSVIGTIVQTGGLAVTPYFANLYFDLNPLVSPGSDLGFELGSNGADAFIPDTGEKTGPLSSKLYTFSSSTSGGLTTLNFSLANSLFTQNALPLKYDAGLTYEDNVTLRISQSLSYSAAGGESYGSNRLGTVNIAGAGAVPEPGTWLMMLAGFGLIGIAMRKRTRTTVAYA